MRAAGRGPRPVTPGAQAGGKLAGKVSRRDADEAERRFVASIQTGKAREALAHYGHHDRIGDAFLLDGAEKGLFSEFFQETNRSAEVKKGHRRLASGVKVKGKGE